MKKEFALPGDINTAKLLSVKKRLIFYSLFLIILFSISITAFYIGRWSINKEGFINEEGKYTFLETYPAGRDVYIIINDVNDRELTIQEIYKLVNPSVVTVIAEQKHNTSIGSGIIFSKDGYILTNAHVIKGGYSCRVCLSDGHYYDALLAGYDKTHDLAVLKIEADGLPIAGFGNSDKLTVGDSVYAIGNPLGVEFRGTLTDGIVSAINRDVEIGDNTMTFIQTNAALNEGNSGGPLINVCGQVIGINTVKVNEYYSTVTEGIGFAIPTKDVVRIVNELILYGECKEEPDRWSPWSLFEKEKD